MTIISHKKEIGRARVPTNYTFPPPPPQKKKKKSSALYTTHLAARTWPTLTLSQMTNFELFQIERVCKQQLNMMKMAESSPRGEIADFEQFLIFSQCFEKLSVVDVSQ